MAGLVAAGAADAENAGFRGARLGFRACGGPFRSVVGPGPARAGVASESSVALSRCDQDKRALSNGLGRGRLGGHQHALEVGLGLDPLAQALEDACRDRGRQREHTALARWWQTTQGKRGKGVCEEV